MLLQRGGLEHKGSGKGTDRPGQGSSVGKEWESLALCLGQSTPESSHIHSAYARSRRVSLLAFSLQRFLMGKLTVAYALKEGCSVEPCPLCRTQTAERFWIWEATNCCCM